jgi:5-methylcytosine-specific restriction protein A
LKEGVPDRDGKPRQAIVFQLVKDATLTDIGDGAGAGDADLAALRAAALKAPDKSGSRSSSKRRVYKRSAALRSYVLARSGGICEGCSGPAPFATASGSPYLEPHHVRRISDGGPDHPAWVIALCPNCHARVHHGADGDSYNQTLIAKLPKLEADAGAESDA